jgi:outer membrane protein assembly factor BamB
MPGMTNRRTTLRVLLAVSSSLPALSAAPAPGDDWPQWLGPDRSGVSKETGWRATFGPEGPKRLWKANVGIGYSCLAVRGGRLYTLGNTGGADTLYCLDAKTGREVWKHTYTCSPTAPRDWVKLYAGTRSTPAAAGQSVYSFSRDGRLFCLAAEGGKLRWSVDCRKPPINAKVPTWGFACSPLVLGARVILDVGTVVALDKDTGKLAWRSRAYQAAYSSPVALALAGRGCIATLNGNGLAVVDGADGSEVMLYPFSLLLVENCVTPIVAGDRCFISAGDRSGSAVVRLAKNAPVEVWRNSNMLNLSTNSVLWQGHLYGFHGSALGAKSFRCIEFATGTRNWSTRSVRQGALTLADGKLIAIGGSGELVIADATPKGFKPLRRAKVLAGMCWTAPVLANGRIYCRSAQGDLVCLDVSGK